MLKEKLEEIMADKHCKEVVLIFVDDDISSLRLAETYLRSHFKKIYVTTSPYEALDIYKEQKVDIVISDISMPELNGIEFARKIKEINKDANIIIATNFLDSNYLFDSIKIGIKSYLTKPLDLIQLGSELASISDDLAQKRIAKNNKNLLTQYKYAMDASTILSKTDPKGIITYVNDRFCEISGFSKEELLGKPHSIIRHEDMKSEAFKDLWDTIKNKKTWKGVVKNRKKNGGFYIVDATIIPITNEKGEIEEYIAARHDVTELESYKELLKNQLDSSKESLSEKIHFMAEYEKAIDAGSAFCRTSIDKNIRYVNDTFCEMLGYNKEDLVGKNYYDISDSDFFMSVREDIESKIHNNEIWRGLFKHKKSDGSLCHTSSSFVPITSKEGEVVEIMRIHKDITEIINLNKEIIDTQKDIVVTLGSIGEMRSKETAHHVKRVALYSHKLGKDYGLDEHSLELLKLASPMHDIGKVAIPDVILNKPGKLDAEEFEVIKKHTLLGHEMLKGSSREILNTAATIALEHHEKWDGSGYPHGKKSEDIHIFGRITAIADVYDALGSKRCYKDAWGVEEICELLKREKGKAFEPRLVEIFFNNIDYFEDIRKKFSDES